MLCYITLSRCHADDTVRCLQVPGVSHTECHSPGPRSALCVTALGAGPAGHSRVSRCPGCPRHASRDQVRDTGDTRHWPAPTGLSGPPGPLRLLCSSQSLSASRDLVTLVTGHTSPSLVTILGLYTSLILYILFFQNIPDFSWSQVSVTLRSRTVTRLTPELHNVSS